MLQNGTTIQIESGIPCPARGISHSKYPWHFLEVGQSFFVADGNLNSLRASCSSMGVRLNRKFVSRRADGGVRIWRTA